MIGQSGAVGTYGEWLASVERLLQTRKPPVLVSSVDPAACQKAFESGMSPVVFASQPSLPLRSLPLMSEAEWSAETERLLRRYRPDVPLIAIDPAGLYKAYLSGMTPAAFASQQELPLRAGSVSQTPLPAISYQSSQPWLTNGAEKKIPAGVLAILLGGLGVHKFYLGYTVAGIIQIALTCCFGIGAVVGVVEGIIYLTKSDADFDATYVGGKREWF